MPARGLTSRQLRVASAVVLAGSLASFALGQAVGKQSRSMSQSGIGQPLHAVGHVGAAAHSVATPTTPAAIPTQLSGSGGNASAPSAPTAPPPAPPIQTAQTAPASAPAQSGTAVTVAEQISTPPAHRADSHPGKPHGKGKGKGPDGSAQQGKIAGHPGKSRPSASPRGPRGTGQGNGHTKSAPHAKGGGHPDHKGK